MKQVLFVILAIFIISCEGKHGYKRISGTYKCDICLYPKLDFRESGKVNVQIAYTISKVWDYSIENNYVYIVADDKMELKFKIVADNIIEGEGLAKGTYTKKSE